jgi:transcriptional regulator with XRE-family HTH domain
MVLVNEIYDIYVGFNMTTLTTYNSFIVSIVSTRKALGKTIREIRKMKDLTQEALGEKANLSYKFIGEVERGKVNVSLDSLVRISQALKVQVGDLFRKGKEPILKIPVKDKTPYSKLSNQDKQTIKKALKLLNKTF